MALPVVSLPRDTVEVHGEKVEVRGLSRAEAFKLTQAFPGNPDAAEAFLIACGAGVTEDEARAWREATDPTSVGKVVDRIVELSGLASAGGKDPS
jgi:hypothetical protein